MTSAIYKEKILKFAFARVVGLTLLIMASALPRASAAQTLAGGVKFDSEITVAGSQLVLNGAGVRSVAIFKVYAAGLYLAKRTSSLSDIISPATPKRYLVVFLREIDGEKLGKQLTSGIEKNATQSEFAAVIPTLLRLSEIFARKTRMAAGESYSLDYIPDKGTQLYINGKPILETPLSDPVFFPLMMRIVLGEHPADSDLKAALLGQTAGRSGGSSN